MKNSSLKGIDKIKIISDIKPAASSTLNFKSVISSFTAFFEIDSPEGSLNKILFFSIRFFVI